MQLTPPVMPELPEADQGLLDWAIVEVMGRKALTSTEICARLRERRLPFRWYREDVHLAFCRLYDAGMMTFGARTSAWPPVPTYVVTVRAPGEAYGA